MMKYENKSIGFLILTASKIDSHTINLFDRLIEFENATIVVHHDELQAEPLPLDFILKYNIKQLKPFYRTYWSHLNNVLATIDGLKTLYEQSPEIDWFVTLTPSCYPIKSISKIQRFYNTCEFDVLIDMHQIGASEQFLELDKYLIRDFVKQPWIKIPFLTREGVFHWKQLRKSIKQKQHPFLDTNIPYQGSNWFSINRKVVKALLDKDIKHGELVQFYENHIVSQPNMHPCPQETILPTFIGNLRDIKICRDNYRYINWSGTTNWSPNILDMRYWDSIIRSNSHWARKFCDGISDELRDNIDNKLLKDE